MDVRVGLWRKLSTEELSFWTVVLEKTLESPLDFLKEISLEYSLEWPMLKLKLQYFGYLMRRADSFEKTLMDAGDDWKQEKKGTTEAEMVGFHHRLNRHGFRWTPGVTDGQGGLAHCGHRVAKSQTWLRDWAELNRTELKKEKLNTRKANNPIKTWGKDLQTFLQRRPTNG